MLFGSVGFQLQLLGFGRTDGSIDRYIDVEADGVALLGVFFDSAKTRKLGMQPF